MLRLSAGSLYGRAHRTATAGAFRVVDASYERLLRTPRHTHERALLCAVLDGSYVDVRGGRTRSRNAASVFILPAGDPHVSIFETSHVRLLRIETLLDTPALHRPADLRGGLAASLATTLLGELSQNDDVTSLAIEGLALELIAAVSRDGGRTRTVTPAWLDRVVEMLHAHFDQKLSLAALAAEAGVHRVHLASEFRRRKGITIGDYVRRLRVDHARRRLTESDAPLAAVAFEAGFASQSHFTTLFRTITGMTPARYRRLTRS